MTVAARALANRRNYTYPTDIDEYIAPFSDGGDIAEWARGTVALAVREGIVERSSSFDPTGEITRGETALFMYRLFLLLYDAPPVEIRMDPPDPHEDPPVGEEDSYHGGGSIELDENVVSPFTMILFMIVGFVLFCIVMLFCAFYAIIVKKRKAALMGTGDMYASVDYEQQGDTHADPAENTLVANVGIFDVFAQQEQQTVVIPATFGAEFPDSVFGKGVVRILNNRDGGERSFSSYISDDDKKNLAAMTTLNLRKKDIKSLIGIKYFTSLIQLDCANNKLTELDISQNTMLRQVLCFGNRLTELDVSANAALVNLYCYNNLLEELDVSKNLELETLNCANNRLKELDISKNPVLSGFHCYSNYMDSNPDVSVPDWRTRWSSPGTSWDGSAFQFFPQNMDEGGIGDYERI